MTAYTTTSISSYNDSPPPDDGSQVSANEITWSKHKTKLTDPLKSAFESLDSKLTSLFGSAGGFTISLEDGGSVASAATLPLTAEGNYWNVTGTTTITALAAVDTGSFVFLRFAGALTLTHDATNLILPGGANITTAAGDIAIFHEYASGDWRCLGYMRAGTQPNQAARIATGTYTGDGTTLQIITGIGFRPKYLEIVPQATASATDVPIIVTTDVIVDDNASGMAIAHRTVANYHTAFSDEIVSLDADGFRVDDAGTDNHPNKSGQVYNYLAIG